MEEITLALCALTFGASVLALLLARRNLAVAELSRELAQKSLAVAQESLAVAVESKRTRLALRAAYVYFPIIGGTPRREESRRFKGWETCVEIAFYVLNLGDHDTMPFAVFLEKELDSDTRFSFLDSPKKFSAHGFERFSVSVPAACPELLKNAKYFRIETSDGLRFHNDVLIQRIADGEELPAIVDLELMENPALGVGNG